MLKNKTGVFRTCLLVVFNFLMLSKIEAINRVGPLPQKIKNDSILIKKIDSFETLYLNQDYTNALQYGLSLLDDVDTDTDKYSRLSILFLTGDTYDKTNNYRKSLLYYKKVLFFLTSNIQDKDLSSIGDENYAKALLRIGAAFHKLSEKDSAKIYYNKLGDLNSLNPVISSYQATSFSNLSGIYQEDSIFDRAEIFARKALNIHIGGNDRVNQARAFGNLGSLFLSQSEFGKSKELYFKGINLIEHDNGPRAIRVKASLYYNLAWAMRNLKEYQAYDYQEMSFNIKDVLRDKEVRGMIEAISAKHDVNAVRQEEEIKREKVLNQKQNAQKTAWIVGIGSCFVIVSLVLILKQYKLRQKYLSLELSQQELEQQQHIEKLKNESQIRILNATLDGKESERKQIAETLHDSVSTMLSSAHLHLEACKSQFNGSTPVEVDKSQTIIDEAAKKIRDLSHTLVSSILLKFGLKFAIKDIAEKFSNSELTIDHDARYMRRYDLGFEIKLYNIAQEFLNNVLKHSKAKAAKIVLVEKNRKVILVVEDNGRGFEEKNTQQKDGIGISQIKARIQMMGGKLDIESKLGKGTKVTVQLPIVERVVINV